MSKPSIRTRLWQWTVPDRATLRVMAYSTFVFIVCSALAARAVYADVKEIALAVGHELGSLEDLTRGAETIAFNGERMHHSSGFTSQPLATVLDRFETYCAEGPTFAARALADIPTALRAKVDLPATGLRLGVVRSESGQRGMLACFVDERAPGLVAFRGQIEAFLASGNLASFGKFRYVFAETAANGQTHVATFWSDGDLNLARMFPREGDAAGRDSTEVPRPPNSRRTVDASAEGMPFALRVYESALGREALERFYDATLETRGWSLVRDALVDGASRAYARGDGAQVFLSLGEDGPRTFVTLMEAGRPQSPTVATVRIEEEP